VLQTAPALPGAAYGSAPLRRRGFVSKGVPHLSNKTAKAFRCKHHAPETTPKGMLFAFLRNATPLCITAPPLLLRGGRLF